MHWEAVYVNPKKVTENKVLIEGDECRHLRVLHKKKGDLIWAVDGEGVAYHVELHSFTKDKAVGEIQNIRRRLGESAIQVTLAQGLIKGDRFDWLVEKATEMGVHQIIPMQTEKSVAKASAQKRNRWIRIALSAMKQCGRTILPKIEESKTFDQVLALSAGYTHVFIAEQSDSSFSVCQYLKSEGIQKAHKVLLLVGSESGFSEAEIDKAKEFNLDFVHLGQRRLRAETAGVVLLTLIQNQLNELS